MSSSKDQKHAHLIPDVDECAEPGACDEAVSRCENSPGSYSCVCKDGFAKRENGTRCIGGCRIASGYV